MKNPDEPEIVNDFLHWINVPFAPLGKWKTSKEIMEEKKLNMTRLGMALNGDFLTDKDEVKKIDENKDQQ